MHSIGLKPTFGLVPYTGALATEPNIDHLGPMCKTVQDVALLLEVINSMLEVGSSYTNLKNLQKLVNTSIATHMAVNLRWFQ